MLAETYQQSLPPALKCMFLNQHTYMTHRTHRSTTIQRGHIDLVLKAWLQTPGVAEKLACCYDYPPMGGFTQHTSGCDPRQFGEHTAGRPSAFETDNPAVGTRQASDPKCRGKYFIQWRKISAERIWEACPTDEELVQPKYRWKSIKEPTASEHQEQASGEEEDKERKRTKRHRRAQHQVRAARAVPSVG